MRVQRKGSQNCKYCSYRLHSNQAYDAETPWPIFASSATVVVPLFPKVGLVLFKKHAFAVRPQHTERTDAYNLENLNSHTCFRDIRVGLVPVTMISESSISIRCRNSRCLRWSSAFASTRLPTSSDSNRCCNFL